MLGPSKHLSFESKCFVSPKQRATGQKHRYQFQLSI